MRNPFFRFCLLGAITVLLLMTSAPIAAPALAQESDASPEQQLIDKYVPIVYIREHQRPCATAPNGGEPYLPLPVELVLGNDQVVLRDAGNRSAIATGVTAQELATYGPDTYLDFPGNARRPGCTFETDERARTAELGLEPTTYARIILDPESERMMVQYWFFWYYNDWNNIHEADWEGIVLFWDTVATVDEALAIPPDRVGYAQHGGGELADWGANKLSLEDGTHPVAYPAAGAHASFYTSNVYLGWGENGSGFGCDVTSAPNTRVEVQAILIPDEIDPEGEFAWLLYGGRWGEQQPSVFNGVRGPSFNSRWDDPWGATDRWRDSSIVVPNFETFGPSMTDFFCAVTHYGSQLLIIPIAHPWLLIPMLAGIALLFTLLFRKARPYFRRARKVYAEHWRVFVGIGVLAIPIGVTMNIIQRLVIRYDPLAYVVRWLDDTAGARLTAVTAIGGAQQLAMVLIIAPAVVQAVKDIEEGTTPGVRRSYQLGLRRFGTIAGALVVMIAAVMVPLLVVIGFPIALWLFIRWQYYNQVIVFEDERRPMAALRRSATLVDGRWWKTVAAILMFDILAILPGILIGFGLLTLGRTAVGFANGVSSLLYALIIPLSVIALTLMYLDRRKGLEIASGA
ncbi:MAG: hypothetical protein IT334_06470 [Thermomicrobiales bacterium]|nr:hypothetical protein [Thermomicrobiales bacterium]